MSLLKSYPFRFALEKAEITAGPGSPFIVARKSESSLIQDAIDVGFHYAVLFERIDWLYIRLGRNVSVSIFVRADSNIAQNWIFAHELFEGFDLQHAGAPTHSSRWK